MSARKFCIKQTIRMILKDRARSSRPCTCREMFIKRIRENIPRNPQCSTNKMDAKVISSGRSMKVIVMEYREFHAKEFHVQGLAAEFNKNVAKMQEVAYL